SPRSSAARRPGRSCAARCARRGVASVATLVHQPIDVPRLIADAARPSCGAVSLFLGTTRDHHDGRAVARLAYEAYEPMALAELDRLEREATARFEIACGAIVHRLG